MHELDDLLAFVRRAVDTALDSLVPTESVKPANLHQAVRWSLFAGGKRIRPALVFATGRTFGAANSKLLQTAAAIEMIHTYSLIHDDLPAMDDDDRRRGKATCHKQFGEATAILAGDVLQTLAFKAIADDETLSFQTRIALISLIANAAGTPSGMVAGQQLDLNGEGRLLSIDEIAAIHGHKTGALISAAAVAGAVIGDTDSEELEAIAKYSAKLGLLFQITDDLLDVTQESDALGKTAGKDTKAGKATYPKHYGVEKTREMAEAVCAEALAHLATIDRDTALLRFLASYTLNRSR